jgi:hypothetical protein
MASPRCRAERSALKYLNSVYVATIFTKLKRYFSILHHVALFHVTVQHVIGHNLILNTSIVGRRAARSASME